MAANNLKAMPAVRRKQLLLLAGGGLALVGIALAVAFLTSPPPSTAPAPGNTVGQQTPTNITAFGAPGGDVNPSESWRVKEGSRVLALEGEIKTMKEALEGEKKAREEAEKRAKEKADPLPVQMPPQAALPKQAIDIGQGRLPNQPPAPRELPNAVRSLDGLGEPVTVPTGPAVRKMVRVDLAPPPEAKPQSPLLTNQNGNSPGQAKAKGDAKNTYLPVSFLRAINLAGVNAPTGGQAQQNPNPIIFRVTDLAQLPNRFKADYRECFVTGAALGDLSSERAEITLDTLNCVRPNGEALEVKVKGYVADHDGKAGMHGRLVTKQGSALAMGLIASVASGIGAAFSSQNTTQAVSALGTTQTVNPGQSFQYGMGQGVNKATDRLAQYYMKLADQIFPVIEVDAGQQVDLIITKGSEISGGREQ